MPKRLVAQLSDQESVNEVFRATQKQLRANRNGDLYLTCRLEDKSGTIDAFLWRVTDEIYHSFEDGDFVRVEGLAQLYHGQMQIIARRIAKVSPADVDLGDFFPLSRQEIERLRSRLREILREVEEPALATLVECFLIDEEFMRDLCEFPAGLRAHHAYPGGLLEHVVTMLEMGLQAARCYRGVNKSLLLAGIFLHDIGKLLEIPRQPAAEYTEQGELVGHIILGVQMLEQKVRQAELLSGECFPRDLLFQLQHILASHHGEYEYGSPKLPMTLEALIVHHLDLLDSKCSIFGQLLGEAPVGEGVWTRFQPHLGRKLYRGTGRQVDGGH
jgi:3'-5' exoribonuclease